MAFGMAQDTAGTLSTLRLWQWAGVLVWRQMGQLKLLMACLFIGVFSLTATLALVETFTRGLQSDARTLLGGDIGVVVRNAPPSDALQKSFAKTATTTTQIVRLRSMITANKGSTLAEIKAVQPNYPLVGNVVAVQGKPTPAVGEIVLAPPLLQALNVALGDRVHVGDISLKIVGIWQSEPDIDFGGFSLAPRAIITQADAVAGNLLGQGSQAYYGLRGIVPQGTDVQKWGKDLQAEFPKQRLNITTNKRPSGNINTIVKIGQDFFVVLSLAIAVISGIGIQTAVRVYLDKSMATLALFKSLGMTQGQVLTLLCMMLGLLGFSISTIGAVLGAGVPLVVVPVLGDILPLNMPFYIPVVAFWQGVVFGILCVYAFASIPLLKAIGVRGADLFRSHISPPAYLPLWGKIVSAILACITTAFVLGISGDAERMVLFLGMLFLVAGGLYGVAVLCRWGLAKLGRVRHTALRLTIANLTNQGNGTVHILVSVGMGLTLFTGIGMVYQSVNQYFVQSQSTAIPDVVLLDIKRDQIQPLHTLLKQNSPTPDDVTVNKFLNVRITAIDGVPSSQIKPTGDGWFIQGDRRATWLNTMPKHNQTVWGKWWNGTPEKLSVSVEHDVAVNYGIKIGSTIDISVLGRPMTATVVHTRDVNFLTPTPNFALIFSPQVFESAPYSGFASASVHDVDWVRNTIAQQFPNVVVISAKSIVEMVGNIFGGIAVAVSGISALALVAGILVLLGAVLAQVERKTYTSVILKMIGGTRPYVAGVFMLEYAVLGMIAGVFSVVPGYGVGYIITTEIMGLPWVGDAKLPLLMSGLTIGGVLAIGAGMVWKILSVKPAMVLRG